jgi:hypothetical protein
MHDPVETAVTAALRACARDEDVDGPDVEERLAETMVEHGWPAVREAVLRVLASGDAEIWPDAAAVLWGAVLDGREMDAHRVIAHLYHALPPNVSDHDENLAWSIASRLKGVGYLCDYDPLADPGVRQELERLRTSG